MPSFTEAKQSYCMTGSYLAFRQIPEVIFNQTLKPFFAKVARISHGIPS